MKKLTIAIIILTVTSFGIYLCQFRAPSLVSSIVLDPISGETAIHPHNLRESHLKNLGSICLGVSYIGIIWVFVRSYQYAAARRKQLNRAPKKAIDEARTR